MRKSRKSSFSISELRTRDLLNEEQEVMEGQMCGCRNTVDITTAAMFSE